MLLWVAVVHSPLCVVLHCVNTLTDVPVGRHWVSRLLAVENNGAVSILVCAFDTYVPRISAKCVLRQRIAGLSSLHGVCESGCSGLHPCQRCVRPALFNPVRTCCVPRRSEQHDRLHRHQSWRPSCLFEILFFCLIYDHQQEWPVFWNVPGICFLFSVPRCHEVERWTSAVIIMRDSLGIRRIFIFCVCFECWHSDRGWYVVFWKFPDSA